MRGKLSRCFLVLATAVLSLTVAPAVAAMAQPVQDPIPIGANQFFTGLINNHPPGGAVIYVICPGPVTAGSTGHPAGNQPVEVETAPSSAASDTGYTGSAGNRITATLGPSAATVPIASFTSFYAKAFIPTGIRVPCSGTGTAAFVPSPGSPTARTAILSVTFENIAA